MAYSSNTSHAVVIPFPYRLFLLYIEPLAAFVGAILAHFHPTRFLSTMSATATYHPSNQIIYDQLAATYVLFAFNEAVVLRVTDSIKVWKALLLGILICDVIHLYGTSIALGSDVMLNPALWRWEDAVNISMLVGPIIMRLAFLLGVGLNNGKPKAL